MVGVLVHALVSASLQAPPPPLVLVFALACEPLAGGASDGVALEQSLVQVLAGTCAAKHYHATLKKRPWRANLDKQARNGRFGVDAPRAGLAEQPCRPSLMSKAETGGLELMQSTQPWHSSFVKQP